MLILWPRSFKHTKFMMWLVFRLPIPVVLIVRLLTYPRYIKLTPVTTFEEVLDPGAGFVHDSFDFVPFDQLSSRLAPFPYLSDVVGRLVSISEPDPVICRFRDHNYLA
ncbi:hypothetical protein LINGRAHAP2_LOCUS11350 [Linum grandiflorum]